jgi:hypothetical protein
MLSQSQFNEIVGRIKARQVLLNKDIQACAVFAIELSVRDRNSTNADTLFHALSAGMRRQSLVAYFEKFGNLAYSKTDPNSKKNREGIYFFDVEEMTGEKPGALTTTEWATVEWYKASKESIVSNLDIQAKVIDLLKQIKNAQKKQDREVLHAEYVPLLEAIASGDKVSVTVD